MISQKFDFLSEPDLQKEFEEVGTHLRVPTGEVVIEPQKYIKVIPLLLDGSIKVLRQNEDGNELIIYYIQAGESCAMSLTNSLMDKLSSVKAIVEEDAEVIVIPVSYARKWYDLYPSWRMFVLRTMIHRYDEIINALDGVAFKKIDERLLDYLHSKVQVSHNNILTITHQEIAKEMSTSREVISRLLKIFEQQGILKISRNKVEIISSL